MLVRTFIHVVLHILVPGIVARLGFADRWKQAWLIMVSTMVIDLDHLLANPVFDPLRCGIGLHPLHSYPAIVVYLAMAIFPKFRIIAIGLVIHMLLDGIDCIWLYVVPAR
jgi:hypothetical protein